MLARFSLFLILISCLVLNANANEDELANLKKELAIKEREIEKIAKDYEAFAYSQWMKQMYEGVPVDPVYGGGKTEEIYRDLLIDEYGKEIVKKSGTGISKNIEKEIKKSDSKYKKLKSMVEQYERSSER